MTNPIKVTPGQARRLQRNVERAGEGRKAKRMTGREILPGVVFHVSDDVEPETVEALQEMVRLLMKQMDVKASVKKTKKQRKAKQ